MIDIKTFFEDDDLIVLDKPPGLTVNKSETTKEPTLQDIVEKKIQKDNEEGSEEFLSRGGIVHRLDKDTSGLILVAKNKSSFYGLQKQFKDRSVDKTYITLVHGDVKPDRGEISVPVGRLPWNRKRFGVLAGGREAETIYEKEKNIKIKNEDFSLLKVTPKTGRTHQIRVHMKHIGHPVFGDILYAGRKTSRADRLILDRLFLHAGKISFNHPVSGKRMIFESKLPNELANLASRV